MLGLRHNSLSLGMMGWLGWKVYEAAWLLEKRDEEKALYILRALIFGTCIYLPPILTH